MEWGGGRGRMRGKRGRDKKRESLESVGEEERGGLLITAVKESLVYKGGLPLEFPLPASI